MLWRDHFAIDPCLLLLSYYISLGLDALAEAFCGVVGSGARVFAMVGFPCICHLCMLCKLCKLSHSVLGTCSGSLLAKSERLSIIKGQHVRVK